MSLKDKLIAGAKQALTGVKLDQRAFISRTSNVVIVYWHWKKENFGTSSNVQDPAAIKALINAGLKVDTGVIDNDISSCDISKNIESPSASFNISLLPSQNWKQILSPGDWVAIYFLPQLETPSGGVPFDTKNLVMIGNIDRVSRSVQKDEETDTTQMRYSITGRNFGKVFEQTDVWYDPYSEQVETLDVALRTAGLEIAGNPSKQVDKALNVFLGDGDQFQGGKTSALKQWVIPSGLAQIFTNPNPTAFSDSFFDLFKSKAAKADIFNKVKDSGAPIAETEVYFDSILKREITPELPGYQPRNMITPDSNGSLWDLLKRSSNELINEVFLEEARGADGIVRPTLFLRPRPVNTPFFSARDPKESQYGKEDAKVRPLLNGAYKSLQDLAREHFIEIHQSEIIYENLGRDDHSRINMIWLKTDLEHQYMLSPTANVDGNNVIGNPTYSRPSIQRNGLRRMDSMLEFCHTEDRQGGEVRGIDTNINLFKAFVGQLYDMSYANHLYEQGTIECTGVLEAELGKALVVKQLGEGIPDKIYFIEGYEHKWTFPNTWTTTFTVTKGQFRDALNPFIDVMGPGDRGQADNSVTLSFVAKTEGKK